MATNDTVLRRLVERMLEQSEEREDIVAPEDEEVLLLCVRYGYGAVMDAAARQWRKRDPIGALVVGDCIRTIELVLDRGSEATDGNE